MLSGLPWVWAAVLLSNIVCARSFAEQTNAESSLFAYYTKLTNSEPWERSAKTGKYADVVVRCGDGAEIRFWCGKSYLPSWKTQLGEWSFPEVIARSGDGPPSRPDRINRYSRVRIIRQEPEQVVVHWRYAPDMQKVSWDGFVDEYFYVKPGGKVRRTIRAGTPRIDDWNDPAALITQAILLKRDGLESDAPLPSAAVQKAGQTVAGAPIMEATGQAPATWWRFDEGMSVPENQTTEQISGVRCPVAGHTTLWKRGVSGTALLFDGYDSSVTLAAAKAPVLTTGFTLEAWIALGAYPFQWAPIVHQSQWQTKGYYLGVDKTGRVGVHAMIGERWRSAVVTKPLPLFRWHHVVATWDGSAGRLRVYVDGQQRLSRDRLAGQLQSADGPVTIGLNSQKMPSVEERIGVGKWPSRVGIDGLIDEVRVYPQALSASQVRANFQQANLEEAAQLAPDLATRRFPAHPRGSAAESFGASYERLAYHESWDNMWRVSDHPDVVVRFDTSPVRFVFWRGLGFSPGLVTENGKWAGDQSSENYKELGADRAEGCCEHMSDKQCRHAHVRIIENNDARVVVHWRYGMVDSRYIFPDVDPQTGWGDWADEYWTIYPDAVAVRHLERGFVWGDSWVETMFYSEPGSLPEDHVELDALTLVDLEARQETYSWKDGSPECDLESPVVSTMNTKSIWKPFNVYPIGSSVETFPGHNRLSHFHLWNHYPVSQITSDGRAAEAADRAAHSSLVWGSPSTNYLLYGLTNKSPKSLLPLARSWNLPPGLVNVIGADSSGYRPEERAYHLAATGPVISLLVHASEERPLVNPCFVIAGWSAKAPLHVEIDEESCDGGSDFRQGAASSTDGQPLRIIWLKLHKEEVTRLCISSD